MFAAQAERIAALEAEIEELKRLMGRNSNNSSMAPSKDSREAREQRSKKRFTPINVTPVHEYERGSWGPAEADRLAPAAGWYAPRVSGQVVTHPVDGDAERIDRTVSP